MTIWYFCRKCGNRIKIEGEQDLKQLPCKCGNPVTRGYKTDWLHEVEDKLYETTR